MLDWKAVGRFLALFVDLCTLVRKTFTELVVGIEILPWVLGEGKEAFVEKFLKPLGQEFLKTQRVRLVDENTIQVNLGLAPKLPFVGAKVEWHEGEGWVTIQKRVGGLYVGGKKVVLCLSERQQNGKTIRGHELKEELTGKPVLNANILDALLEFAHLIPEDWKGKYIFFWATGFRNRDGNLYVRCLDWDGGRWYSGYRWLGSQWNAVGPVASLSD